MEKVNQSVRKLSIGLGVILACSIGGYQIYASLYFFEEKRHVGNFVEITHRDKSPTVMHSGWTTRGRELCSKTLNKCWHGMLLSSDNERFSIGYKGGAGYFSDSINGIFLKCLNCKDIGIADDEALFNLPQFTYYRLLYDGFTPFRIVSFENTNTNERNLAIIKAEEKGITIKLLLPTGEINGKYSPLKSLTVSRNQKKIAWIICEVQCALVSFHLETQIYKREEGECIYYRHLQVKWENETPIIRQSPEALKARAREGVGKYIGVCENKNGKPVYSIWTPEELRARVENNIKFVRKRRLWEDEIWQEQLAEAGIVE